MEIFVNRGEEVELIRPKEKHSIVVPEESRETFNELEELMEEKLREARRLSDSHLHNALFLGKGFHSDNSSIICCDMGGGIQITEVDNSSFPINPVLFISVGKFWDGFRPRTYIDHAFVMPYQHDQRKLGIIYIKSMPELIERMLTEGKDVVKTWQPLIPPSQDNQSYSQQGSL